MLQVKLHYRLKPTTRQFSFFHRHPESAETSVVISDPVAHLQAFSCSTALTYSFTSCFTVSPVQPTHNCRCCGP